MKYTVLFGLIMTICLVLSTATPLKEKSFNVDEILLDITPSESNNGLDTIRSDAKPFTFSQEYLNLNIPTLQYPNMTYPYNEDDASIWVRVASASYCATSGGTNGLETWTCKSCKDSGIAMTKITRFKIPWLEVHGYVGYAPAFDRIMVIFTGSTNISNWMTNLDFGFIHYEGAPADHQVHKGFYTAYMTARPTVLNLIAEIQLAHPTATVAVTGHSLGGALANHMIVDLAIKKPFKIYNVAGLTFAFSGNPAYDSLSESDQDLLFGNFQSNSYLSSSLLGNAHYSSQNFTLAFPMYTFGQPRLGNPAFASYARGLVGDTGIYRVVNHQDPVPHLPPIAFQFTHLTTEVYFDGHEDSKVCSTTNSEDVTCSNQFPLPMGFSDHMRYVRYNMGSGQC